MCLCRHRGRPPPLLSTWPTTLSSTLRQSWPSHFPPILTMVSLLSPSEDRHRFKGNDSLLDQHSRWDYWFHTFLLCRQVILDISSTVVDESKEIVIVEFASLSSSNATLRMTCMSAKAISCCLKANIEYCL